VRWRHPSKGLIFPNLFVPLAEETGLITQIGDFVLRMACAEAASWPPQIRLAVNLSLVQFRKSDLPDMIMRSVGDFGLRPEQLELEITETALIESPAECIPALRHLKNLGITIALDDFGTGYSSLNYLKRLPIDQLKIDRSFVHDMLHTPHASTIVRAIVSLAHSLGLSVVAEGVETEEEWASLCAIGCGGFQGFLFAQALPIEELTPLLGRRSGNQRPMWRPQKPGCALALTA
jgi:EAL domain-containing protein (putative c-di-GMP-specific phosphodiesterase class I)